MNVMEFKKYKNLAAFFLLIAASVFFYLSIFSNKTTALQNGWKGLDFSTYFIGNIFLFFGLFVYFFYKGENRFKIAMAWSFGIVGDFRDYLFKIPKGTIYKKLDWVFSWIPIIFIILAIFYLAYLKNFSTDYFFQYLNILQINFEFQLAMIQMLVSSFFALTSLIFMFFELKKKKQDMSN